MFMYLKDTFLPDKLYAHKQPLQPPSGLYVYFLLSVYSAE